MMDTRHVSGPWPWTSETLRLLEDRVSSDSAPDDMRLAFHDAVGVLEGRSSVVSPRHLEDARRSLDGFDAEAFTEDSASPEIVDEVPDGGEERCLVARRQGVEVCSESGQPRECRQRSLRGRGGPTTALGASP